MIMGDDAKIKEDRYEQGDQEYDHLQRYIGIQVAIYLGIIPLRQVSGTLWNED